MRCVALLLALCSPHEAQVVLDRRFFVLEVPLNVSRWSVPCDGDTGYQYSMESQFLEFLQWQPSLRTYDWRVADFIWLAQCVTKVYWNLRLNNSHNHEAALAKADAWYLRPVAQWANAHPAWQRHSGANFVTVYAMDLGRQDFPVALAETRNWSVGTLTGEADWLQKALSMSGFRVEALPEAAAPDRCAEETRSTAEGRIFYPQDFVISIPSRFISTRDVLSRARAAARTRLAFFAGSLNSCARRWLHSLYGNMDPAEVWVQSSVVESEEAYQDAMLSSKFCLVLRGSSHTNNVRLVDVMAHGCVPVIVSDDFHPPLESHIPWRDVALFFRTADLPRLIAHLREVDDAALRENLLEGETPPAQALDFVVQDYWGDIFQVLASKLEQSLQAPTSRTSELAMLRKTALNLYTAFLELSDCPLEICLEESFVSNDIFGCSGVENLWPTLAALRSRSARRGEGKAQLVLEVMQEIEDSCPDPLAQQGVTSDWIRLRGSLDPSSAHAMADPNLVENSCATSGCFLLLLRGAAASKRSLLSAEPLLTERLARFLLFEFHDKHWGSLTVYHAGHFLLSLGYVCFLVARSDLFLFSGGLWDEAYALNAHVYVLCGQLEDEELGLLLQVHGLEPSRSRNVLRDFRTLYGYG
eukprot:s1868_g8.t1